MSKKKKPSEMYMPFSSLIFNNEERRKQHVMRLIESGRLQKSDIIRHQEKTDTSKLETVGGYARPISPTKAKANAVAKSKTAASKKSKPKSQGSKNSTTKVSYTLPIQYFFEIDAPQKYGFEARQGQQAMAHEVANSILCKKHLLVEAGVGIGKSFAYLVPLLLHNQRTGVPVIVATSTIALQEQLCEDAKRLQTYLKTQIEIIVAKGQSHYVCRNRAYKFFKTMPSSKALKQIQKCINEGCSERKEFSFTIDSDIWAHICVENYNLRTCSSCAYKCPYKSMRSKLLETRGIIICNQDLLTVHLYNVSKGMRPIITPRATVAVIDEAHDLENRVRSITTKRYKCKELIRLMKDARAELRAEDREYLTTPIETARVTISNFFRLLQNQIQQQISTSEHDMKYADKFFFDPQEGALNALRKMIREISEVARFVQLLIGRANERYNREYQASNELDHSVQCLNKLVTDMDNHLIWIEQSECDAEFVFCPKNTRTIIKSLYFDSRALTTILTSATLTNNRRGVLEEQYSYFISNTGFPAGSRGVLSIPKQSPFPYDKHAMIYYCDDLPHPTKRREEFFEKGIERLIQVLHITEGKALVLFTAKSDMEETYKRLMAENLPYKILVQQNGSSQEKVLREFRENVSSVLLGTGAYWEGISIEGHALSSVIIFRLPFPVPDPIIDYKSSIAGDSLMQVSVPEMITKLRQGIGRLIRNFTDTGIVSIIDCRLKDTPAERYHDVVWNSLPICNRTNDIRKLRAFYEKLCVMSKHDKDDVQ